METSDQRSKSAEIQKNYYHRKRIKEQSILKSAMDLLSENREMSLEEKEILRKAEDIKARRLKLSEKTKQYLQKQKAAATPEKLEAFRLKRLEQVRRSLQKQKAVLTPEEIEATRLEKLEKRRVLRQEKREKEESILRKAMDLLSQNKEMTLKEYDIVRHAEEIKAKRLKFKQNYRNRKAAATPEEEEAMRLKKLEQIRRSRQNQLSAATHEKKERMRLKSLERNRQYRQDKREEEESILRKAAALIYQIQEMSLEEKEILRKAEDIKEKRFKLREHEKRGFQRRKAAATPEEIEAMKVKKCEQVRRYRQKQKAVATAEEIDALRLRNSEQARQYRKKKREKEDSILRKSMELLKQNHEMSSDEKKVIKLAEKIKANRLRKNERRKQKQTHSSNMGEGEKAAMLVKFRIKTVAGKLSENHVSPSTYEFDRDSSFNGTKNSTTA